MRMRSRAINDTKGLCEIEGNLKYLKVSNPQNTY